MGLAMSLPTNSQLASRKQKPIRVRASKKDIKTAGDPARRGFPENKKHTCCVIQVIAILKVSVIVHYNTRSLDLIWGE